VRARNGGFSAATITDLRELGAPCEHSFYAAEGGVDDVQRAHGRVHLRHLRRQPGAEVA
jgi:hypothetical protein